MGDFKYQDGLVHFVFANRDTYFLESMVRLSLEDKLYRELSMQGCRRIFYLKRGIHPCVLGTKDRASYEFCALAARKKALFGFRKGTEIPDYSGQDVVRSDEELRAIKITVTTADSPARWSSGSSILRSSFRRLRRSWPRSPRRIPRTGM